MKTNLTKTEKSANCNCEIPQPKGKCSENGIDVYCNKCGKSYSNQSNFLKLKELFYKLTDEERMEIISDCCTYCGKNEKELGKCYCAPCYDI